MKKALLLISQKEIVELKGVLKKEENKRSCRLEIVKVIRAKKLVISGEVDDNSES